MSSYFSTALGGLRSSRPTTGAITLGTLPIAFLSSTVGMPRPVVRIMLAAWMCIALVHLVSVAATTLRARDRRFVRLIPQGALSRAARSISSAVESACREIGGHGGFSAVVALLVAAIAVAFVSPASDWLVAMLLLAAMVTTIGVAAYKTMYDTVREIHGVVDLRWFVFLVAWFAAIGFCLTYFGRLGAGSEPFFVTMAQLDGALLIAAAVVRHAPPAWRRTQRDALTWVVTAPAMALLGLGAALLGVLGERSMLLVGLAIAPVLAVATSLILSTHAAVTGQEDETRRDRR